MLAHDCVIDEFVSLFKSLRTILLLDTILFVLPRSLRIVYFHAAAAQFIILIQFILIEMCSSASLFHIFILSRFSLIRRFYHRLILISNKLATSAPTNLLITFPIAMADVEMKESPEEKTKPEKTPEEPSDHFYGEYSV